MKEFALEHPFGCDEIVYFAENGSEEADLALRDLIAERTDRGDSGRCWAGMSSSS